GSVPETLNCLSFSRFWACADASVASNAAAAMRHDSTSLVFIGCLLRGWVYQGLANPNTAPREMPPVSVRLDSRGLEELCIPRQLVPRGGGELVRRRAAHREALVAEPLAHARIGERLHDLGIEACDDLLRSSRGRHDREPGVELEARQSGGRHRGYVRKGGMRGGSGHAHELGPAAAGEASDGGKARESEGHLVRGDRRRGLGRALVRDM